MRLGLLLLAVVVLCSGQMCGGPAAVPPTPEPSPDRLVVNDHLRVACAGFAPNDATIETLLLGMESDRLSGIDKRTQTQTTVSICTNSPYPDLSVSCHTCSLAVIEQVYGQ